MYIDTVRAKLQNIHRQLEAYNIDITANEICNRFCGVEENTKPLLTFLRNIIKRLNNYKAKVIHKRQLSALKVR